MALAMAAAMIAIAVVTALSGHHAFQQFTRWPEF